MIAKNIFNFWIKKTKNSLKIVQLFNGLTLKFLRTFKRFDGQIIER